MSSLSKLFPSGSRILIDGGLVHWLVLVVIVNRLMVGEQGSTLEDVFRIDTASSLWSSEALIKNPGSVIEAHLLFLRAGARLIETASYQGSFSTYARAGYSQDDAIRLMRSSVALAAEARKRFATESHAPIDSIKIALSLAAYGASLPLPHEFDGFYPPPYGPQAYVQHSALPNRNAFRADERAQEAQAEAALAAFHLERLRAYAADAQTWRSIDALAFETVPLTREVRAIRRAVAALEDDGLERKPWWVCAVYTGGEFPEQQQDASGGRLGARDVLAAYFGDSDVHAAAGSGEGGARYAVPDAFGVNCTAVAHVATAVAAVSDALEETGASPAVGSGKPWLVLKPNGGQTYDMNTRKWGWHGLETPSQGDEWAGQLGDMVRAATSKGVWGGILVGGCCKTGDDELRALAKVLA
ncbi:Homocysteine S-methyltransferase [Lactarius hatsudake]|nr:Homocysteine S-methyltransferase [Lactarius hatsudake]